MLTSSLADEHSIICSPPDGWIVVGKLKIMYHSSNWISRCIWSVLEKVRSVCR